MLRVKRLKKDQSSLTPLIPETRNIWVDTLLNDYLNFPHIGQAFKGY